MSLTFIADHIARALKRLPEQYKNKPKASGMVEALAEQVQQIEDALKQLQENTTLATAEGVNLDTIGEVVGLERVPGQDDETYRSLIRIRIIQNTNTATPEEIIAAAKFFLEADAVIYTELYPAGVSIASTEVVDPADVDFIKAQLQRLLPAGVGLAELVTYDEENPFLFNTGGGFGDVNDPSVGGLLADIL